MTAARAPFPDVVVVVPGIMGSSLTDATGREVWGLQAGAILRGVLTLGRGVRRLQLPDGIGDDHPGDGVRPGTPLLDLHVIPGIWTINVGYQRLLDHLRSTYRLADADSAHPERPANLVPFACDWRLSNRYNGRRLKEIVEPVLERWRAQPGRSDARLIFICHSMGGLVARWYLDREGGAEHTRTLVTLGTPHRGAACAIDRLVNGLRRGLGPIAIDLTAVVRSLPSIHQLLPEYACISDGTALHKTTETELPNLSTQMVADAMLFHEQLDSAYANANSYDLHPIVGIHQPTLASARIDNDHALLLRTIRSPAGTDDDEKGDGTVPRFAARPKGLRGTSPTLHHIADTHIALPANQAILDEIDGILTGTEVERRAAAIELGVTVEEITVVGEPVAVAAEASDPAVLLEARLVDPVTRRVMSTRRLTNLGEGRYEAFFDDVAPAGYEIAVGRRHPAGFLLDTVTTATVVVDPVDLNAS